MVILPVVKKIGPMYFYFTSEEIARSRTAETQRLNLKFLVAEIQVPLPNKYLRVGYKGLVFCRNNG